MLVMEVKVGQRIQIGDNITIVAVATEGNSVRIGIDAPVDVSIERPTTKPIAVQGSRPFYLNEVTAE